MLLRYVHLPQRQLRTVKCQVEVSNPVLRLPAVSLFRLPVSCPPAHAAIGLSIWHSGLTDGRTDRVCVSVQLRYAVPK